MNYRHIYHAGNFADVLKHAVLARIVTYLKGKDKAFRVIDTHAGLGLYDLGSTEAQKTGEWRSGIGRVIDASMPEDVAGLLSPYLDIVRDLNAEGSLTRYPGSPLIARRLFRKQDRLSAIELHPADVKALQGVFEGDYQARVISLDGWLALGAHVPPKEKRGLVLVDPPFEAPGEFDRMVDGLARATRRWRGGTYCLWYPIKPGDQHAAARARFHARVETLALDAALVIELSVGGPTGDGTEDGGLSGSGLVVINPPYTLESEMQAVLPFLAATMARDSGAGQRMVWLGDNAGRP
jgi:23S rRNA (adenine2030-N6)-methyltransferase